MAVALEKARARGGKGRRKEEGEGGEEERGGRREREGRGREGKKGGRRGGGRKGFRSSIACY